MSKRRKTSKSLRLLSALDLCSNEKNKNLKRGGRGKKAQELPHMRDPLPLLPTRSHRMIWVNIANGTTQERKKLGLKGRGADTEGEELLA